VSDPNRESDDELLGVARVDEAVPEDVQAAERQRRDGQRDERERKSGYDSTNANGARNLPFPGLA
jgi:hypothetical protein